MGTNLPSAPDSARTFFGDPNPPPEAPEAPKVSSAPATPSTSAGTGQLPPEATPGQQNQPRGDKTYSVVEGADGVRRGFAWDKDGPAPAGEITNPDAEQILHAVGTYNPATKTWDNIPPEVFKSLSTGRLSFPERIMQAWNGGEAGIVRSLLGAKVMAGELAGADAREQGAPELVKMRLDSDPVLAWRGGFGKTVAEWLKHPVAAAEEGAVGVAGMAPMMKDIFLHGTVPGGVLGASAGTGLALATGPAAPADFAPLMVAGMSWGARLGTAERAYKIFGGQFAMDMADKGYEDETIRKYAPAVGVINAALTAAQFELMTPSMQAKAIKTLVGSGPVKAALAKAILNFGGRTAGFTALMDAQTFVNDYVNNMAAEAEKRPDLLTPSKDMISHLGEATLKAMATGGILAGVSGALEGAKGSKAKPAEKAITAPAVVEKEAAERSLDKVKADNASREELESRMDKLMREYKQAAPHDKPIIAEEIRALHVLRRAAYPDAPAYLGKVTTPGEVVPSVEEEKGLNAAPEAPKPTVEPRTYLTPPEPNQYVPDRPLDVKTKPTYSATGEEIVKYYTGNRDEMITAGNQLAKSINKGAPGEETQLALRWYAEAHGDKTELAALLKKAEEHEAEPPVDEHTDRPSTLGEHVAEIRAALKLGPEAMAQVDKGDIYFREAGETAKKYGVIGQLRDEYSLNHLYLPEKPDDVVNIEGSRGMNPRSSHGKARVYDTLAQAAEAGKKIAPIGYGDLIGLHATEMARAVTAAKVLGAAEERGLFSYKMERPSGWRAVAGTEKSVPYVDKFGRAGISHINGYAPEGIAKALEVITKPDFSRQISWWHKLQQYQGMEKAANFAFSFFHHASLLAATVNEGDFGTLLKLKGVEDLMDSPAWQAQERDAAFHGLPTTMSHPNFDSLAGLRANDEIAGKLAGLPGVKQALSVAEAQHRVLFDKWARYMSVQNFTRLATDWVADHPNASGEELGAAKREIARHVGPAFGSLNWEVMGIGKTSSAIMRTFMLAPAWFTSNATIIKQALTEGGVAGGLSRKSLIRGAVYGYAFTQALRTLVAATGGKTNSDADKEHPNEVEVAPHVYFSGYRGPTGEVVKIIAMMRQSGWKSPGQYAQARGAGATRAVAGFLTGTKYSGAPVIPKKDEHNLQGGVDMLKFIAGAMAPIPFSVSNMWEYAHSGETTPMGVMWMAAGARYAPERKGK